MNIKQNKTDDNNRDRELIESFKEGKVESFNRLVKRYEDMIFNLCYKLLNDYDEANDCAQDTFIKVYKNINNFQYRASFSTWIYRIAINTCKNHLSSKHYKMKKRSVSNSIDPDREFEIEDSTMNPETVCVKNETKDLVLNAINNLPESEKILIILRDLEGKAYEEISNITGIKLGTVKSRLARARHILRNELQGSF